MKMIDVTSSYPQLVKQQLETTDATLIHVFSLGKTTVIYTAAPKHLEIVIVNKTRNVKQNEIDAALDHLIHFPLDRQNLNMIREKGLVEISIPVTKELLAKQNA